jgi:hypothetical protein
MGPWQGKILFLSALLAGCAATPPREPYFTPHELTVNPRKYDGQRVVAIGWVDFGFEKRFLLQSKSEIGRRATVGDTNCVSIEVPTTLYRQIERLNHSRVLVVGVFRADLAGDRLFFGLCSDSGIQIEQIFVP